MVEQAREAPRDPILVVEDDRKTASLIALYLEREGFSTVLARDGREAVELFERRRPRFVILDLMLPAIDGWELCRRMRGASDVPILILTAREEEMDRVLGLTLGADDYVIKPFSPRELMARVHAILRRARPRLAPEKQIVVRGALRLDLGRRKLSVRGRAVLLTPSEFRILEALMTSPGRIFSRSDLLARLYPQGGNVVDRVVDVHVGKLRRKLERDSSRPEYILTARGVGYEFAEGTP